MSKKLSRRFIRNVCQICLGAIMLCMSYNYVKAHDAEKVNFVSGITVLKQKAQLLIMNALGEASSQDFQRYQEMVRNYKELLSYMQDSQCSISITPDDMQNKLVSLEKLTPAQYKLQAIQYTTYASQVYEALQKCAQK